MSVDWKLPIDILSSLQLVPIRFKLSKESPQSFWLQGPDIEYYFHKVIIVFQLTFLLEIRPPGVVARPPRDSETLQQSQVLFDHCCFSC